MFVRKRERERDGNIFDIIHVQPNMEYREVRGGREKKHAPFW